MPTISRVHAKIICRNNQTFLIDLNSRNGTELDGEIIQPETEYLLKEEFLGILLLHLFKIICYDFIFAGKNLIVMNPTKTKNMTAINKTE